MIHLWVRAVWIQVSLYANNQVVSTKGWVLTIFGEEPDMLIWDGLATQGDTKDQVSFMSQKLILDQVKIPGVVHLINKGTHLSF